MRQYETLHKSLVEQGPAGPAQHGLFLLLQVLSVLYGGLVRLRDFSFRSGLRKVYRSRLPVISVGNLAVGGTGKTPLVDLLVRHLQQKGMRVAVVSRGYGGNYRGAMAIVSAGNGPLLQADTVGDEPCLLARRNPQAIVLVAAKRRVALEYLDQQDCADVVILDDAFQHRQVARDLNLLLLDAVRPFGNRYLLPAGLLREPPRMIRRADFILLTGADRPHDRLEFGKPVVEVTAQLAGRAFSLEGGQKPLAEFASRKVLAFAGIARPERFFAALEQAGIEPLATLALGDHATYDAGLVARINAAAAGAEALLTTEKDAVKLVAMDLDLPCYVVPLEIAVEPAEFLFDRLDALMKRKTTMPISDELLGLLACPKCKGPVTLERGGSDESLHCAQCRLAYPVRDGIPVMLIDEAKTVDT